MATSVRHGVASGTRSGAATKQARDAGDRARRAAWSGDTVLLSSILVKRPSLVTTKGRLDGATPAHWACLSGHGEVLSLLVQLGCTLHDLRAADTHGQTPLHWAAIHNQEACVLALQEQETDPVGSGRPGLWEVRDKRGRTAAHWAAHLGNPNTLNQLRMHYERHGKLGQEALHRVLSTADSSGRNVMQLWSAIKRLRTVDHPTRMSAGVVMMRCPELWSRELLLSQNRRLIADVDELLSEANSLRKESNTILVAAARAPQPLPYKWTRAAEREEALRLQRQLERRRRLDTRAAQQKEAERMEAEALMACDEAALEAVRHLYSQLESEAQADEEQAVAHGDVPHVVEAELQLDVALPADARDVEGLRQEFMRELAQALGLTEEQMVDVSFVQS